MQIHCGFLAWFLVDVFSSPEILNYLAKTAAIEQVQPLHATSHKNSLGGLLSHPFRAMASIMMVELN
jgi:hypothetical protein